jgi:hypothetical protein
LAISQTMNQMNVISVPSEAGHTSAPLDPDSRRTPRHQGPRAGIGRITTDGRIAVAAI